MVIHVHAKYQCPAGAAWRSLLTCGSYIISSLRLFRTIDLTEVPDDKTCTEELQKWHVPKKSQNKGAVLFEDLLFPQEGYFGRLILY